MENENDFRKSLAFTLKWEVGGKPNGGYTNDPSDLGGETKWGISKRYHPNVDIKNLTPEQALQIYATEYWDGCGCDSIPFPYCTVVFDTAVDPGIGLAKKWLRQAADVANYLNFRKMYFQAAANNPPSNQKYLAGWLNRTADLAKFVQVAQQDLDANQKWGGLG